MIRRDGFTLTELMLVIVIIGILTTIAVPGYLRIAERSKQAEGIRVLGVLRDAQLRYFQETGTWITCNNNCTQALRDLGIEFEGLQFFRITRLRSAPNPGSDIAEVQRQNGPVGMSNYKIAIRRNGTLHYVGSIHGPGL